MSKQNLKAVGDKDPTNFPKSGDNKKVSLRNSEYKLFPMSYAEKLKEEHPDVWALGGNIEGNNQYRRLIPIAKRGGTVETKTEEMAVRKREAWAARHLKDFRIAGTIAQIKWLVIGEKGLSYMKNLIQAEITRRNDSDKRAKKDLGKKSNAKAAMDELAESTQKTLKKKGKEHNDEYGKMASKRLPNVNYLAVSYHRGLAAYATNPASVRPTVTSASQWAMGRVNGLLYALRNGKFKRKPYDTDLLPSSHPNAKKEASETKELRHVLRGFADLPLAPKETDWGFDEEYGKKIIDELGIKEFQNAFLFHLKGDTEDPKTYKLPVAKIIDGELKLIFRGVIAAGSSLRGSDKHNSGYYNLDKLSLDNKKKLYNIVKDLYKKFDEDAPLADWEKEMNNKIINNSNLSLKSEEKLDENKTLYKFNGRIRANIAISSIKEIIEDVSIPNNLDKNTQARHIQKITETEDSFVVEFAKLHKEHSMEEKSFNDLEQRMDHGKHDEESEEEEERMDDEEEAEVRMYHDEDSEEEERMDHPKDDEEDEEDRDYHKEEKMEKYYIEGIASSTSIDSHGTEMARTALQKMSTQIRSGIPILPSHASHNANGIGEWDEVIGRTIGSDIIPERNVKNAADKAEQQYLLKVRSVLYKDEPKTKALLRRLERGEPIGQSIGGWFENVEVVEEDGKIQRVIVNDVTLDHIAITRAPSNPDSINLMTLSIRSELENLVNERKAMPKAKLPMASMDTRWNWDTKAQNQVLGVPEDWDRYATAHLYVDLDKQETKSGYKLPVAKMIDGKLTIVYRGVVAAMSALNGARGGVDIPKDERSKIYETIKKYYEMFDKEAPPLRSVENDHSIEDKVYNKSEPETVVDTVSKTGNNNAVESIANDSATTNKSSGEDMTENDLAKFAEMLKGALAPIAERVAALEATPKAEIKEEKVEVRQEETAEMAELRARLQKAENMITRVIETPIRRGSHKTPRSGILAEDMYTRSAVAAEKEGLSVLPKIVKRHAEALSNDNNKLTKNDLIDMLTQGLRAAEMDGILNHSTNAKLWQ